MIWDNEPKNPLKGTLKVDRQILNSCLFLLKWQNNAMRYVPMFTFPQSTLYTMSSVATLSNRPSTSTKSTMPTLVTNSIMSSMSKSKILIIYHPNIFHVLLIIQSVWRYSLFFRLIMKTLYDDRWLRGCWREKYGRCLQFIQQRSLSYFCYQSFPSYLWLYQEFLRLQCFGQLQSSLQVLMEIEDDVLCSQDLVLTKS